MKAGILGALGLAASVGLAVTHASARTVPPIAVAPQYDTTHVYVAPDSVDAFVTSFLATFGGHSTKQIVATVTPTPSSTTSQLLLTPVGTLSIFGFSTPVPYGFGTERTGYLVRDIDAAVTEARRDGADVRVATFPDPIGRDVVVQWPGGVNMQLYWHTKAPAYDALETIPDNRVYVSPDRAEAFVRGFDRFSGGHVVSDDRQAAGDDIGRPHETYRRISLSSDFGNVVVLVTDGHLPFPYGHEMTGYAVSDVQQTLDKATRAGAKILAGPVTAQGRISAVIGFPGGYIAEIHAPVTP